MTNSKRQQKGAAVLITVVLMFVLVTLVTIYTSRIVSINNKISLNDQNRLLAKASAEAGLIRAYGLLSENPNWSGSSINETSTNGGSFTVSGVGQVIARESTDVRLITLTSTGVSADGLARDTITEQAFLYSILANTPDAPLILSGGIGLSGNFEVAANPNGGGEGVPLSIWTDGNVDLSNGSGTTCGKQELLDGQCSTSPYSEKGSKGNDILDNDSNFPSDIMEYMFNVSESNWESLRDDADILASSCAGLNVASVGLIWVDGPCSINAGTIIGSAANPVIVIVTNNDITMNGGAILNGMLLSFRKPGDVSDFEINMIGGAAVNGLVASNHQVGNSNGTFNAIFDADILAQLEANDAFKRVARVPGSWRDF
jgi:Tfp pilus assembly protein PilX